MIDRSLLLTGRLDLLKADDIAMLYRKSAAGGCFVQWYGYYGSDRLQTEVGVRLCKGGLGPYFANDGTTLVNDGASCLIFRKHGRQNVV